MKEDLLQESKNSPFQSDDELDISSSEIGWRKRDFGEEVKKHEVSWIVTEKKRTNDKAQTNHNLSLIFCLQTVEVPTGIQCHILDFIIKKHTQKKTPFKTMSIKQLKMPFFVRQNELNFKKKIESLRHAFDQCGWRSDFRFFFIIY